MKRWLAALLGAIGISLLVVAVTMPTRRVTAVPVTATAVDPLTVRACNEGHSLRISFAWQESTVTEVYDSPPCDEPYVAGQQVQAFVASNDSSNVGRSSDWILDPSAHDPFDFIGPNDLSVFIGLLAVLFVVGSAVLFIYGGAPKSVDLLAMRRLS